MGIPGKIWRFLRQTYSEYVIVAPSSVAEPDPPEGFTAAEITQGHLDAAEKSGRMPPHKARFFRKLLRRGATRGCVILAPDGVPAGWSFVSFSGKMSCHTDLVVDIGFGGCIHDTFVAEEFRRRGLGHWLNALIVNTFGKNITLVCLVRCGNLPALKNWDKAGAVKVAEIRAVSHFHGGWRHRCKLLTTDEAASGLTKYFHWER